MALSKHPANWRAIRQEFESTPLSIRSIALKFNIPKTTLLNRIRVEQWQRSPGENMTGAGHGPTNTLSDGPTDADPVSIAQAILRTLRDVVAQTDLDMKSVKMLSDSIASCQKVIIAAGPAAQEPRRNYIAPELIACMPESDQNEMERILTDAEQRLAALRDEKITPMRKV